MAMAWYPGTAGTAFPNANSYAWALTNTTLLDNVTYGRLLWAGSLVQQPALNAVERARLELVRARGGALALLWRPSSVAPPPVPALARCSLITIRQPLTRGLSGWIRMPARRPLKGVR